jgi:hypothetical protein
MPKRAGAGEGEREGGRLADLGVHGVAHEAQLVRGAGHDLVRRHFEVVQQALDGAQLRLVGVAVQDDEGLVGLV